MNRRHHKRFYSLFKALQQNRVKSTFTCRGKTDPSRIYYEKDMGVLKNSHELKDTQEKCQRSNPYTTSVTYEETMDSISNLMERMIRVGEKERKLAYQEHQQMNREMER